MAAPLLCPHLRQPDACPECRFKRSGAGLLAGTDPDALARVRDVLLEQAARAREDIVAFFDFVMVDERTNKRIKALPHQRVLLRFITENDRTVTLAPPGASKTYCAVACFLWWLGRDPSERMAIVSATEAQAEKVVAAVASYILNSSRVRLVFPELRPTNREGEPWTRTRITVRRAPGVRDPSLTAFGIDTDAIFGSRLSRAIGDDLLNEDNVATPEMRAKVHEKFNGKVGSRIDPTGSIGLMNTAWHPDDAVHRAIKAGWATLRMTAYGDIFVQDDVERAIKQLPPWDTDELRLANPYESNPCRLTSHDPDPDNVVPLWPSKWSIDWLEAKRRTTLPVFFNREFLALCRDDDSALCKQEYVDACLKTARDRGIHSFVSSYDGNLPVFIGVDLAFEPGEERDENSIVSIVLHPDGLGQILDIESGQWAGPVTLQKVIGKFRSYCKHGNGVVAVETNGGQKLFTQFALAQNLMIPVRSHTTTSAKAKPHVGIPGIFTEMMNGAWAFPNTPRGQMHPEMQKLIDACLYYRPQRHTDDRLMAFWIARAQAAKWGALGKKDGGRDRGARSLVSRVMSR